MVTTSPDGLFSPDAPSQYNLTVDLAAMQVSVQTALANRAKAVFGRARRTTTAAVATGDSGIPVTTLADSLGGVTLTSNGLSAPTAGIYNVSIHTSVVNNADNTYRDYYVRVNGTEVAGTRVPGARHASGTAQSVGTINYPVRLAQGDVVTIGTAAGTSGTAQASCDLSISRIGTV